MKIKISNTFLVVLALMIAINGIKLFIFIMLACLFHEIAHYLAIKSLKIDIEEFSLSLIGGSIKCYALNRLGNISLIFIYSAGIVCNFVIGFICCFIGNNGFYSRNFFIFAGINFLLAIFNAFPIKILDGYFILQHFFLLLIKDKKIVAFLCDMISFACNIALLLLGIYYAFHINFSILMISTYLLICTTKNNQFF